MKKAIESSDGPRYVHLVMRLMQARSCLLLAGLVLCTGIHASLVNADSLFAVWQDASKHDTVRLEALNRFLWAGFMHQDPDSTLRLNDVRLALARSKGYLVAEAEAYNMRGYIHSTKGDHDKAIADYTDCLRIYERLGKKSGVGVALSGIGSIYYLQGDHVSAMPYFEQSLAAQEAIGNEGGIAISLNNIGNVHADSGEPEKALGCYERVLKIRRAGKDVRGIATALNNIGLIRADMAVVSDRDGNSALAAIQREKAINDLNESIVSYRQVGDQQGECGALLNIASIYADEGGKEHQTIEYSLLALPVAQKHGFLTEVREAHWSLYKAYRNLGRSALALEMYERYIVARDSIRSEDNKQEILRQHMQYGFDKQQLSDSLRHEGERAISAKEIQKQKLVRNSFMGGFALVALFAGVFFAQRNRINKEKMRSEELLLNILPAEVAEELKAKGEAEAKLINEVTVLFTDFKGFTAMSEQLSPKELVADIHECFSAFDHIMEKHGIEKIKTIGDAYMAAGGLPTPNSTHALDVVKAALDIRDFIAEGKSRKISAGLPYFEIRIGIHTGPVVAGIVGVKKFAYDIWGDTVNTASRMESSGEVGQVNISESTYELVKDVEDSSKLSVVIPQNASLTTDNAELTTRKAFTFTPRGKVQAKGKGEMEMYFVSAVQ